MLKTFHNTFSYLRKNEFFRVCGPPQVFEKLFFRYSICFLNASIEQSVLITNIKNFLSVVGMITEMHGIYI